MISVQSIIERIKKSFGLNEDEWEKRQSREKYYISRIMETHLEETSNCIDVGAYKGEFIDKFMEHAPNGSHWAFEPMPDYYEDLKQKYRNVKVKNCALSDEKGKSDFIKVEGREAWSGLKRQEYPEDLSTTKKQVKVDKLDNIIKKNERVDFIKIDVEGAEQKVIRGGITTIRRNKPVVIFEHAKIHTSSYQSEPKDIYKLIKQKCDMDIYTLNMEGDLSKKEFCDIYNESYKNGYGIKSHTNFVAIDK